VRALVTGAAGFIGSHLVDRLLMDGHEVIGLDSLTDYYDPSIKRANLSGAQSHPKFVFVEADLVTADLEPVVADTDVIFHQAAQPGVRGSWADGFRLYAMNNVLATQRLLEAAVASGGNRFIYASSSSIYGNAARYPTREDDLPLPHSPYGVTKLAGEHLCSLYGSTKGLHVTALRYFTVYGPRQRPDMGVHRFISSALAGDPLPLFGTGEQLRDFTFVDDVVGANVRAATSNTDSGLVCTIAGGSVTSIIDLLMTLGALLGRAIDIQRLEPQAGDVAVTNASSMLAQRALGWRPSVALAEGLNRQIAWQEGLPDG